MPLDERNRRILDEACKILENMSIGGEDSWGYKTELQVKSVAAIIRLASGSQIGPVGTA